MYKLAVFDLDGTLLDRHHEISNDNKTALRRLSDSGCHIVIATGRPDMLVKEYLYQLNLDTPVISCNGAMIRQPISGQIFYQQVLPKKKALEVLSLCKDNNHIYMAYTSDAIVTTDNYRTKYFQERNKKLDESCRTRFIIEHDVKKISENFDIYKILIIERDEKKYNLMKDRLEDLTGVTKVSSAKGFYDIMPLNTSKKNAIDQLIDHFNIKISEVVAFGDNYNDVEMLKHVGTAITTSNGVSDVKEISDFISIDHNDSGIAHAINSYIFKDSEA